VGMSENEVPITAIENARVLIKVGDSITTDHISPAGAIISDAPAGRYLIEHGVQTRDFNSYGSRRGNDRVMTRGTFANVRFKNHLADGREGGFTKHLGSDQIMPIYDASLLYKEEGISLIGLAGKEYGAGSSRDWAAKGTYLLGIEAIIAESYERIHRSNLVGMGVLPLQYKDGETAESLGITGHESFNIQVGDDVKPRDIIKITAKAEDGKITEFEVLCRIDTPVEVDYYRNGGILHTVLRNFIKEG